MKIKRQNPHLHLKDWCSIDFNSAGKIIFARITKISLTENSEFYDVEVPISENPEDRLIVDGEIQNVSGWTRIHGIASTFVSKLEHVEPDGSIYKKGF